MVLHVENILCVENVDDKVVILENLINGILDRLASYKIFVISNKSATPSIADGTLEKIDAYKDSFNKSGDQKYWEAYKFLVKTIKSISSGIDNINISTINLFLSRIYVVLLSIYPLS